MPIDYKEYAHNLKVKPVHQKSPQNDTGYLTPSALYTPYVPFHKDRIVIHGTVGANTLPYFASKVDKNWNVLQTAGSISDGRRVLAHQLIPKDDFTIYDLVPQGYGCGHCNPGILKGMSTLNYHAMGIELENLQNGESGDPFTEAQYIKLALTIAYHAAVAHVSNQHIGSHAQATLGAIMAGQSASHVDPDAGPFDWGKFWGHLWEIRKPTSGVFDLWGIPLYDGSN